MVWTEATDAGGLEQTRMQDTALHSARSDARNCIPGANCHSVLNRHGGLHVEIRCVSRKGGWRPGKRRVVLTEVEASAGAEQKQGTPLQCKSSTRNPKTKHGNKTSSLAFGVLVWTQHNVVESV
eukprot:2823501-Rhodomonas_salina.3